MNDRARIWRVGGWLDLHNTQRFYVWRYMVPKPGGGALTGSAATWATAVQQVVKAQAKGVTVPVAAVMALSEGEPVDEVASDYRADYRTLRVLLPAVGRGGDVW